MRSTMNRMHTARFAQVSCARFACSENTAIMMILDAVSASIFALIIRIIRVNPNSKLAVCHPMPRFN